MFACSRHVEHACLICLQSVVYWLSWICACDMEIICEEDVGIHKNFRFGYIGETIILFVAGWV